MTLPDDSKQVQMKGQVVLITGAGRGMGRALARAFALSGAMVAANDFTPVALEETVRIIRAEGGRAEAYVADIAKDLPVRALVDQVCEEHGRIDVLVNQAFVQPRAPLLSMDGWEYLRTVDVNLNAPFWLIQAAGLRMQEQGGGVILNIGSAESPAQPPHDRAAYFATRAALPGLTRAAAAELIPYNIRVHAICPVFAPPDEQERLQVGVCRLALTLCSPDAAGLTGQVLQVNFT